MPTPPDLEGSALYKTGFPGCVSHALAYKESPEIIFWSEELVRLLGRIALSISVVMGGLIVFSNFVID